MNKLIVSLQLLTVGLLAATLFLSLGAHTDTDGEKETVAAAPVAASPIAADDGIRQEIAALKEQNETLLEAIEWLAIDVQRVNKNTWEIMQTAREGDPAPEPEAPEAYRKLFDPETRELLVAEAAKKGVVLLEDRVEVPAVIVQNRAILEFFAVTAGGKVHEAVVAVTGNAELEREDIPEGLAGMINACILALGYEKGTPVKATRDGKVIPPSGKKVFVYLEWVGEDGKSVRARAEDLVFNNKTRKPMERGKWVYIGSRFEQDWADGETRYMADLTGDVVATYSWQNTIIDNTTSEGSEDIYYVCYTPRIPEPGTKVTLVIASDELPAKEFPKDDFEEGSAEDGGDGK